MSARHPAVAAALGALLIASGCAAPRHADPAARASGHVAMVGRGIVSTDQNEFGGALSADGREIYFAVSSGASYEYVIAMSRRSGSGWTEPALAPFADVGRNYDPVLSPDGRRLYFVSDRASDGTLAQRPDPDLWVAERAGDGGWGRPRRLDEPLSTRGQVDSFASEATDGTLYLALARSDRPGVDLYRARRTGGRYAEIEPLGAPVETPGLEGEPIVAPDQSFLLFSAYERAGGHGNWDIYISRRTPTGGWSEPMNLGPEVNTPARDYSPRLAPDGHTLIFTSERHFALARSERPLSYAELTAGLRGTTSGSGNIYTVDLRALGVLPP
jgi:WD40 repeat protein